MKFKRTGNLIKPGFIILSLTFLFLAQSLPDLALASLGEDIISRQSWKKISLDLEGASLINVLKVFSQQSGLNFIAAQDVAGRPITLYLENVPIREALEKILHSYNLTYELDIDSNIFVVKNFPRPSIETITKVYSLKYARVNSSPLNSASEVSIAGSSLADTLQSIISSYGKLSEDSRTNSLIITDIPIQFDLIEQTIRELDVPIPQVLIEVEIIDTSKNLVDQLGFNWANAGSLFKYMLPYEILPSTSGIGGSNKGMLSIGGPVGGTLTLAHLKTHSETKVLARPKILTLSNEKAQIKIVGDDVIGTERTEDVENNTVTVTAERSEIGVQLTVTPSVNAQTGEITMVLEPRVTSAEDSSFTDGSGNTFRNPQERSAKVTVVSENNQTIILGGLLRHDMSETKSKVPVLGDIPFLGSLFRYKNKSEDKDREMLVFITPRIINNSSNDTEMMYSSSNYNVDLLTQREQSGLQYRKEEIDKTLTNWDN